MNMLHTLPLGVLLLTCLGCQSARPSLMNEPCPAEDNVSFAGSPHSVDEVDVPAQPVGGLSAVQRRVEYPRSARQDGVQGEVMVQFIVDERGCVVQAAVVQGIDPRLDAEALRVIRTSRFEPAREAGEAVAIEMTMPISFHVRVRQ